jgi:hypothetical protein
LTDTPETLIKFLNDFAKLDWANKGLRNATPKILQDITARYLNIGKTTPFAPSSIGKKKPKSGRRIPDSQFGIDSGAIFNDLQNLIETDNLKLTLYSVQAEAEFLQAILENKKGVIDGLLGMSDETLDEAIELIGDQAEYAW